MKAVVYAKVQKESRVSKDTKSFILVIVASFLMALNIKSFVESGNLFPGGFNGLTVLIQRIFETFFHTEISYTLINMVLNAVPAYIGFKTIGKRFTIFSLFMVFLTGFFVDCIPNIPVTDDRLLVAVFGGILNGTAIGIALQGRASSGGTDFIAVYLSTRFNTNSWNVVLGLNAVMLCVAGYLFGWDAALYSIIFQFVSTQVVNYVHQSFSKATLCIITSKADILEQQLLEYTHHGVTRFDGVGCYENNKKTMLYTVIPRDEVKEVVNFVRTYDDRAFINVTKSERIYGHYYQDPLD